MPTKTKSKKRTKEPFFDISNVETVSLNEVNASICKKNFFFFCQEFWETFDPATPIFSWYHEYICKELQEAGQRLARGEKKHSDIIINMPPSTSKSSIVSILFFSWLWSINPRLKILCCSYANSISLDLSTKARTVINSDKYKQYFPHVILKADQQGKTDYHTTLGGSRFSTSVGAAATGKHADLILIDDPINLIDIYSDTARDQANQWVSDLSSRKTNNDSALTVLVAQRLHVRDTTGFLLAGATDPYQHICLPAEYNKDSLKPASLKPFYDQNGGLLDPVRLSLETLKDKKAKLLTRGYNAQYIQNPGSAEDSIIQESWFDIIEKEKYYSLIKTKPAVVNFFCDTAFTTNKKRNDPSVIIAATKIGEMIYIINTSRVWLETTELVEHIRNFTAANGYNNQSRIYIEPKGSGQSVIPMMRQQLGLNVVASASHNRLGKIQRLNLIAPTVQSGRVVLVKGNWNINFLSEVTEDSNKHDDQMDAFSICISEMLNKKSYYKMVVR